LKHSEQSEKAPKKFERKGKTTEGINLETKIRNEFLKDQENKTKRKYKFVGKT